MRARLCRRATPCIAWRTPSPLRRQSRRTFQVFIRAASGNVRVAVTLAGTVLQPGDLSPGHGVRGDLAAVTDGAALRVGRPRASGSGVLCAAPGRADHYQLSRARNTHRRQGCLPGSVTTDPAKTSIHLRTRLRLRLPPRARVRPAVQCSVVRTPPRGPARPRSATTSSLASKKPSVKVGPGKLLASKSASPGRRPSSPSSTAAPPSTSLTNGSAPSSQRCRGRAAGGCIGAGHAGRPSQPAAVAIGRGAVR